MAQRRLATAAAAAARPKLNLLHFKAHGAGGAPAPRIFDVLQMEEALFRGDTRNWCFVTEGSATPAIVMGIGGKPEKLIHVDAARRSGMDIVKRFTGGGTVVVDDDTLFVGFVCNKDVVSAEPGVDAGSAADATELGAEGRQLYPRALMEWTARLYEPVFERVLHPQAGRFGLREHDYVLGDRKCGGNAQSLSKDRFVHHTSFLWDYRDEHMALLQIPDKRPDYRESRDHSDFVLRLGDNVAAPDAAYAGAGAARAAGAADAAGASGGDTRSAKDLFIASLLAELELRYTVVPGDLAEVEHLASTGTHRKANRLVDLDEGLQ